MERDTDDPFELTHRLIQTADNLQAILKDVWTTLPGDHQSALLDTLAEAVDGFDRYRQGISAWGDAGHRASAGGPDVAGHVVRRWIPAGAVPAWWVEPVKGPTEWSDAPGLASEPEVEVAIYLDRYSDEQLSYIQTAALDLAEYLGYGEFSLEEESPGSIFRRWRGKMRAGMDSESVARLLKNVEQRLSIEVSGRAQAEVDEIKTQNAVNLVAALSYVPNAVVRVGALMVIKYSDWRGDPVLLMRELSASEIQALERNPGIQREPERALELLALAVQEAADPVHSDSGPNLLDPPDGR